MEPRQTSTHGATKDKLELLIALPPPPEFWNRRHAHAVGWVDVVLGSKARTSSVLGQHSTNRTVASALCRLFFLLTLY